MKEVIIPHKKAEDVLSRDHIEREKEIALLLDDFVSSIKNEGIYEVDLSENMKKFMEENNISGNINTIISRVMSEGKE